MSVLPSVRPNRPEQLSLAPASDPGRAGQDDPPPEVRIAGRRLRPTAVFNTYWRFAAERQRIYEARLAGAPAPWTADPILRRHRFTNCYRAADRVSQFLIREVSYAGSQEPNEVVFRTLLFKLFNRIDTWRVLTGKGVQPSWADFSLQAYDAVLTQAFQSGARLYSAAYVIPPPRFGANRKHSNHLRLLALMMRDGVTRRLLAADSMPATFRVLRSYPTMGDFLAYQFLIDLNYSGVLDFDENDFVVPGPGALDGIRKCFGRDAIGIESEVIHYAVDEQNGHFERLGLPFGGLRGRPLKLIDCQNLFCEIAKYARLAHPDVPGSSGRTRIKQNYRPDLAPLTAWFPPKWGINATTARREATATARAEGRVTCLTAGGGKAPREAVVSR
jgi:alpha-glutamyl/putrescinyl thymine pyrophosphorylase clade 1